MEQMQLMPQPIFKKPILKNSSAGCHLLTTEAECIESRDGRPEFSDSPCHWCCGRNCIMDNTTSLCEPWEKLRNHSHYVGQSRSMSFSSCPGWNVHVGDYSFRNSSKPAWADLDKDGDLDLIVGNVYGELYYYERMNDGSLLLHEGDDNPFQGIDFGSGAAPAFVDWDKDGEQDLVIGNYDGKLRYYQNTGDNTFVSRAGLVSMDGRWMKHANWKCMDWGSKHVPVALISAGGLLVWSLGTLFGLAFFVFRNRHHMAEPAVGRLYAYFVQGYEIEYCWWDVLVKRLDLLCTVVITYTNIASDPKAKLLCYTALSAIVMMLHAGSQPFDDRKNRLLDRYEYVGLLVRFTTFAIMEFLLIFNPGTALSILCCAVVGIAGSLFFLSLWFTILIEFVSDTVNRGHEATADDLEELMDSGLVHPDSPSRLASVTAAAAAPVKVVGKICGKYVCKAALQGLLRIATRIGLFYSAMESGALAIKFGGGKLDIWTRKEQEYEQERKSGTERKSRKDLLKQKGEHTLEAFFHLNDDSQRQYLATTIGAYYAHLLSTMGSEIIPGRSLECFIVLCASMKAAKLDQASWHGCGVEEKFNLMVKGIPAAVQQVRGKSQDAEPVRKMSKYDAKPWTGEDGGELPESGTQKEISASPSVRGSIQATAVAVDEDLQAEEEEMESNKMKLHAEELNESLMILLRIERTKFFGAVEKVAEALDKWVDPELEPEDAVKLVKKTWPSGESTWSLCVGKAGQCRTYDLQKLVPELEMVYPEKQSVGQTEL